MICISVTPESRKLAKVDLLNASRYCDMIELCLDHLIKQPDISELLAVVDKPILVSCRRPQEGGTFQGSEKERVAILRQAIAAGPAFVELDMDIAGSIPRFGKTKRVVSDTSLDKPLRPIDGIFEDAKKADADVVKFTWPTPTLEAAWPLLAAVGTKRDIPIVGMGLGRAGLTFSLLGRRYGSPWIYAALERGMEAYEGQATVWELNDVYSWSDVNSKTRFVGIVGYGAEETTGIRILNAGFKWLGLNLRCLPLQLGSTDKLEKMFDVLRINAMLVNPQLGVFFLEFAEHAEEAAKQSGCADFFLKQPDGWHAYNMLWRSAVRAVEKTIGRKTSEDRPLDRRNVLVIGAGGPAQSMAYGIRNRKGVLTIAAPDDSKAQRMAQDLGVRYVPFASLYDTLTDVVAIADPAVVVGHKKTELNPSYLRPHMTVLDLCRLPAETEFLSEARQRGAKVVEPREIFIDQLAAQFKSITGKDLPQEAVDAVLAEEP